MQAQTPCIDIPMIRVPILLYLTSDIQVKVVGGHPARGTTGETDEGSEVYLKIVGPRNDCAISPEQCQIEICATERDVEAGSGEPSEFEHYPPFG